MHAPDFWQTDGVAARLLDPLGRVYGLATALRRRWVTPATVGVPVICIGNLTVGGAGKTPTALAVAGQLQALGARPHFLTRGYGGRERGPLKVDPLSHEASVVGDEPLLLARAATTWVAADRVAGGKAAFAAGASHIIMDDGLQNPSLSKDLSLLVVDGAVGFGNRRLLPAGPLREPIEVGMGQVDAVIIIGEDISGVARSVPAGVTCLSASLVPDGDVRWLKGRRVLAFAGIGRPEKFYATLVDIGAELVETRSFPDHHRYVTDEIEALVTRARQFDAVCVTTEKDHVRIPPNLGKSVEKLAISLAFRERETLSQWLRDTSALYAAGAK